MKDIVIGILFLCGIYRVVIGEWPDPNDPDFQRAIEETIGRHFNAYIGANLLAWSNENSTETQGN